MTRFINFWKYTKNVWFMIRVVIAWIFVKMSNIWNHKFWVKMLKFANFFCSKEYIFNTPFWKYLCSSLQEYVLMDKDYETDIWKVIKKVTDKKDNSKYLINIWCNIWRWAIDLAKNYNYKVIAFEPAPHTYYSLTVNIALSDLLKCFEIYNIALWNENTTLNFEYRKFHNGSSHIMDNNDVKFDGWEIIKVPVKRFDDLWIEKEKIENTRLIIMDVEWFELNVLKWMKNTLKSFSNISIIIEIWDNKENKNETIKFMNDLWYMEKQIDDSNRLFTK